MSKISRTNDKITKKYPKNLKIDFRDIPMNCKIELIETGMQKYFCTKVFLTQLWKNKNRIAIQCIKGLFLISVGVIIFKCLLMIKIIW